MQAKTVKDLEENSSAYQSESCSTDDRNGKEAGGGGKMSHEMGTC